MYKRQRHDPDVLRSVDMLNLIERLSGAAFRVILSGSTDGALEIIVPSTLISPLIVLEAPVVGVDGARFAPSVIAVTVRGRFPHTIPMPPASLSVHKNSFPSPGPTEVLDTVHSCRMISSPVVRTRVTGWHTF